MIRRLVVAVLAVALLAGCAPDAGTVQGKGPHNFCTGRYRDLCSDDPALYVVNPQEHTWPYTDRPSAGWVKVTPEQYGRCPIGARYPDCTTGQR